MVCGFSDWSETFGGDAVTFGKTTDGFFGDDSSACCSLFSSFIELTFNLENNVLFL